MKEYDIIVIGSEAGAPQRSSLFRPIEWSKFRMWETFMILNLFEISPVKLTWGMF